MNETGPGAEERPIRLLLVDDDDSWVAIMRHFIRKAGSQYLLDTARDAGEALALLRSARYDLCLLDFRLGASSGLDLLSSADATQGATAFVLMTGLVDDRVTERARHLGVDLVVAKDDVSPTTLIRDFDAALTGRRRRLDHLKAADQD